MERGGERKEGKRRGKSRDFSLLWLPTRLFMLLWVVIGTKGDN